MLWENLLLYVPMSALLVIMPGPDFALVTRVALAQGRAAGTLAACGVALGIGLHTALAMLGISAAIAHFRLLFSLLEYGGGAFLCWMGFQSLRGASTAAQAVLRCGEASPVGAVTPSLRRSFAQGFLTNVLNPKAIVYFLTFLPQFMQPDAPLAPQFLLLGGILGLLVLLWFVTLANLLQAVRALFLRPRVQLWLYRCTGVFFLCFGVRLALSAL
ncbi:LysE family transporter [uncultured Desulfovibrio sp.]|uniref:LysE family translocator n=1 Tax=uncultured Desulfovibrio sp. TaxID=167968 RepID=UPI00262F1E60|nr:LysE family transporter [uncultured Desulfovibrio sp.]